MNAVLVKANDCKSEDLESFLGSATDIFYDPGHVILSPYASIASPATWE